jgi:hypothetical protein
MLFRRFLLVALFHSLIGGPKDFDVGSAERKLGWLNGGGTGFDFVNPVEEPTHRRLIAARSLCSKLHRRRLYLRNLSSSPTHRRGDVVASGLHDVSAEVFAALWSALFIATLSLSKLRVLWWVTAADFLPAAASLLRLFRHFASPRVNAECAAS